MGIKAPLEIGRTEKNRVLVSIPLGNVGSGQTKDILIKKPAFRNLYISYIDCRTGKR
eukprot:TRINITY_DN8438_c0_g1_i1.p4 TRINITY_DN8438_c0_g1~~TRINITY_DN8438_c0_g1_i1.p4  ORF type:complete len:57 (-),score=3.25 TRINITY_DN8438_c0_g1_i1:394-564(-)